MKKTLMFCVIIFLLPLIAAAQDYPKAEIFGGFSILSVDISDREAAYGGQAEVAGNFHENVSFVADLGVQGNSDIGLVEYIFGPRFSVRTDNATVFAHALFGGITAGNSGIESAFAMGLGGGVDVNAGKRLAIRVVQFDWIPNRLSRKWRTSEFRLGFGIVFKVGH